MGNFNVWKTALYLILGTFVIGYLFDYNGYENKTVITITMIIYWIVVLCKGIKDFKKE